MLIRDRNLTAAQTAHPLSSIAEPAIWVGLCVTHNGYRVSGKNVF